jgi:predicted DNA-binding mobile mystery protein A
LHRNSLEYSTLTLIYVYVFKFYIDFFPESSTFRLIMKHDASFRKLRLRQLHRALSGFAQARQSVRPRSGWLSAIREAQGIPLRQIAKTLAVTPQAVQQLQVSEANEAISLKRLRQAADAMGCDLVYALVPRTGLTDAAEDRERKKAAERVLAAEHTMVLEDQGAGDVQRRIEEEQTLS